MLTGEVYMSALVDGLEERVTAVAKIATGMARFSRKHVPGTTNTAPFELAVTKPVAYGLIGNMPGRQVTQQRFLSFDEAGELVVKVEEKWS